MGRKRPIVKWRKPTKKKTTKSTTTNGRYISRKAPRSSLGKYSFNGSTDSPYAEFIQACKCGDKVRVLQLIHNSRVDPTKEDNRAIREASAHGHHSVVSTLLRSHYIVDPSANRNEALVTACSRGFLEIVKLLLGSTSVDAAANGDEPLIKACESGHLEIVKLLLGRGLPTIGGGDALVKSCAIGRLDVVNILLASDVDPKTNDNQAIIKACEKGSLEVVQALLKVNVNPGHPKNQAFRAALKHGHVAIVELLLLDVRVDPNDLFERPVVGNEIQKRLACHARTDKTQFGIYFCCSTEFSPNVKHLLTTNWSGASFPGGPVVKVPAMDPQTEENKCIYFACEFNCVETVKILLADPRTNPADAGNRALLVACRKNRGRVLDLLLDDERSDPQVDDNKPLHLAIKRGHQNIVWLLLYKAKVPWEESWVRHRRSLRQYSTMNGPLASFLAFFAHTHCDQVPGCTMLARHAFVKYVQRRYKLVLPWKTAEEITRLINVFWCAWIRNFVRLQRQYRNRPPSATPSSIRPIHL